MKKIMEYSELGNRYRVEVLKSWINEDGMECFTLKINEVLGKSKIVKPGEVGETFEVSRKADEEFYAGWHLV